MVPIYVMEGTEQAVKEPPPPLPPRRRAKVISRMPPVEGPPDKQPQEFQRGDGGYLFRLSLQ